MQRARPIIFGEVLYDCFEDGSSVLGGAPFNVAWHLQGFGLAPLFISRIGSDPLGDRVLEAMQSWGMSTEGIQRDADHPTGTVRITLHAGQPTFEILADQAYDHIQTAPIDDLLALYPGQLLYHGSLIARSDPSATALAHLRGSSGLPTFVDINLRAPWWRHDRLDQHLRGSRWVKLNHEELAAIAPTPPDGASLAATAEALRRRYRIEQLIVTRGAEGAMLVSDEDVVEGRPRPVERLVDTVGAGDAFSAVVILGLARGWQLRQILTRALEFAATVCGVRGATPSRRELYQSYLEQWEV